MPKNDVVIIDLDRPRELRYGHKALKTLQAMIGKDVQNINFQSYTPEEFETYCYCGLLSDAADHGEDLKLSDMEGLLDKAPSYSILVMALVEAVNVAFAGFDDGADTGNQPEPGKKPASGAGKKA